MAVVTDRYVDYRLSLSLVGTVVKYLAAAPLFPVLVAIYYGESVLPFVATSAVMVAVGVGLEQLSEESDLGHREAFLLVSLSWLVIPILGTIPYLVAGNGSVGAHTIDGVVNALFESMSGFTTTGSTVMQSISFETHSHALLMWRQLSQWLGGMGILVLMVAILPELSVGGAQIMNEEAPGISIEKLTPRIQETARALWKIYVGFTVLAALVYFGLDVVGLADNMGVYNAVAHALTTMPTGGFSPEGRSVEAFSPAVQWAIIPFMVVAGTNFALFWYALDGRIDRLTENAEFRSYLGLMAGVTAVIAALLFTGLGVASAAPNIAPIPGNLENSLRQAAFQVAAIVTTTGYASMDFNHWHPVAQTVLLFAFFLGGSAGSAAGSIKIVRWVLVRKAMARSLFTSIHPDAVEPVRVGDEAVDEGTLRDVFVFIMIFLSLFVVSTVLLYVDSLFIERMDLTGLEAMSVAMATLGNIGPGFGEVGPMNSFELFSAPAKLYMVFLMWIGRLEILSVLVILTPAYWRS
ncbi:TrkH family potassium uptake protein [Halosimplex pelagicum]|uniref:TrkH family potassium uptake protein n=1 Tax=Halosimplex pelagicum TaxID=869886 RepID=A0A7D5T570_9EURY|nr:TrkH family potassium uptake protein [Halosimplex pelagicum]QLH83191.1 TrkH family potassium uptake protein [Halosimplex pelagicum]